jgi:VanZ family protein
MKKTVFWCTLVTVVALSLMPGAMLPPVFNFWDKAQHALGFFGLTWLALSAYPKKSPYQIGMGLLLAGGAIELAQSATGWRYGDWLDLLADAVGIAAALGVQRVWQGKPAT